MLYEWQPIVCELFFGNLLLVNCVSPKSLLNS